MQGEPENAQPDATGAWEGGPAAPIREAMRTIESAVSGGYHIDPNVLGALPAVLNEIICRKDPSPYPGQEGTYRYGPHARLRAVSLYTALLKQNEAKAASSGAAAQAVDLGAQARLRRIEAWRKRCVVIDDAYIERLVQQEIAQLRDIVAAESQAHEEAATGVDNLAQNADTIEGGDEDPGTYAP